ncbi:MAG: hypothetical protein JOZ18_04510, partial [Chloroflexi bacterium]|nr:hypothetical protein [Chloroflexota bacterium]
MSGYFEGFANAQFNGGVVAIVALKVHTFFQGSGPVAHEARHSQHVWRAGMVEEGMAEEDIASLCRGLRYTQTKAVRVCLRRHQALYPAPGSGWLSIRSLPNQIGDPGMARPEAAQRLFV